MKKLKRFVEGKSSAHLTYQSLFVLVLPQVKVKKKKKEVDNHIEHMTCRVKAKKKTKKNVFDIIGWLWERGG